MIDLRLKHWPRGIPSGRIWFLVVNALEQTFQHPKACVDEFSSLQGFHVNLSLDSRRIFLWVFTPMLGCEPILEVLQYQANPW